MYLASLNSDSADLVALEMVPLRIRRFQLGRAPCAEVDWLRRTLDRESREFGTRIEPTQGGRLAVSPARRGVGARC